MHGTYEEGYAKCITFSGRRISLASNRCGTLGGTAYLAAGATGLDDAGLTDPDACRHQQ